MANIDGSDTFDISGSNFGYVGPALLPLDRASEKDIEAYEMFINEGCLPPGYVEKALGDPFVSVSPNIAPRVGVSRRELEGKVS